MFMEENRLQRIFLNLSSCQWKTLRGGASNERQLSCNVVICELKLSLKSLVVWNTWKGFITLYIQLNLIFEPSSEYLEWAYSYFTPPPLIFFLVPFLHISFSIVCYKDKEYLTIQFIFTATLWRGPRGKEIGCLLLFSNPVSDLPSTRLMVTGYWPVLVLSIMPRTSTSLTLLNANRICCTLPVFLDPHFSS